jgi:3-oxoacyl-(acyl-carrier-protein) synthase
MLISEGSTFFVLEEREHALRRDVPILAEVRGWSRGIDPLEGSRKQPGKGLMQAINASLAQAGIQPAAVDAIFPSGPSLAEEDIIEESAIKGIFDWPVPIIIPKTVLGHLQGAATATDVAIGALVLEHQMIPPIQGALLRSDLNSFTECTDAAIRHVLILSGGLGGMHASLIVSKSE